MAQLIGDAIDWWVRARPDGVAFDFEGETLTYRELGAWSDRICAMLADEFGIGRGDVVGISGLNSLEWCVAAVAVMKSGGIATPINYRYTTSEVVRLIDDCSPTVVIVDESERPKLEAAVAERSSVSLVSMEGLRSLQHGSPVEFSVSMEPGDPVVLAYTSGTTGDPKGLVYTHETMLAALFELLLKDPTPPESTKLLMALPLFSVAGIMHAVTHMTCRGASTVVMRDFDPARAVELLARHEISHMNGVPVIYERIAAQPEFADLDLSHVKVAMVGGARVSDSLLNAWNARGVALRHMYGMTEIGGCGTVPRPEDALAHPELCGDGSIFTELKTVRPDGSECDPGEEGEIVMRGPGMMACYWNRPETTAEAIRDGWLHSGDLGVIDSDGYLRYVDRLKDMIISGGFNVSPSEVENLLGSLPGVTEVAVIAVQDERWGETPAAIVYSESGDVDEALLRETAERELAVFKVPRYVVQTDEPLPRMASGKLAKRQLRDDYADLPRRQASDTVGA